MYPWNKYKSQYAYKLSEVLKYGLNELGYTASYPKADTTVFLRSLFTHYGINFPSASLIPTTYLDDSRLGLMNQLIERYWNEYVFQSGENMSDPMLILSYSDILYKTRILLGKIIDIIEYTYPKYSAILSAYDSAKAHLMDKLKKTVIGTITNNGTQQFVTSNSGTRRDNDTPQDEGDYDNDSHTSFISEETTGGTQTRTDNLAMGNNSTEEWDEAPIIERLEKLEKLYQLTKLKWLDEFRGLFTEGGNIHEI